MSTGDRRVKRTQESLQNALVDLILEKGFEATNVSEISDRANVGRSTFYSHYADKEDLLQGCVEGLRAYLGEQVEAGLEGSESGGHPALAFCLPMLEHAGDNKKLFAAMVGRRSGYFFLELAHDMWADIIRSKWTGADEIAVQAVAGAFGATISWWLTKAPQLPAPEVERRFRAAVEQALT